MKLSDHFTLLELTDSITATRLKIDNVPSEEIVNNLRELCVNVLEPVRLKMGVIHVSSGYRCKKLNDAVGSNDRSQHPKGFAADIQGKESSNEAIFNYIVNNLDFDQVINENNFQWVHVSYRKGKNRKQVLKVG